MALLTTFCDECERVGLAEERVLAAGQPYCQTCSSALRIVPGCSLTEDERPLFEDLDVVINERTIGVAEARALARQIAGVVRSGQDQGLLDRLTTRLPSLLPIQQVTGASPRAKQRVLKVLRVILEAKATSRRG